MDIVLDTNIIRKDFKLKDKNFEIILDYLKKNRSKIILPQIAFEEIEGLYKRMLFEKIEELKRINGKLKAALSSHVLADISEININKEIQEYKSFLFNKLGLSTKSIIKYKNEYLPELVSRAIERKKPLDGNGQQFRDGLLWLTILDHASEQKSKRIIFISENHTDFSEKSNNLLNEKLNLECKEKGVEIIYYKSTNDFVREHASKIDFIDDKWMDEQVDFGKLEELFNNELDIEDKSIFNHIQLEKNEKPTGYIYTMPYIGIEIIDHYVYVMSDGAIILNLEVQFEKEYRIELERELEFNGYPHYGTEKDDEFWWIPFVCKFILRIKDKKIISYDLNGWELA